MDTHVHKIPTHTHIDTRMEMGSHTRGYSDTDSHISEDTHTHTHTHTLKCAETAMETDTKKDAHTESERETAMCGDAIHAAGYSHAQEGTQNKGQSDAQTDIHAHIHPR